MGGLTAILGTACFLFAVTGCSGTPAIGIGSVTGSAPIHEPDGVALLDVRQTSERSEPGAIVVTTSGEITDVPNRLSFQSASGKGPFTVHFPCQVPQDNVTLTIDSTTKAEVNCDGGPERSPGSSRLLSSAGSAWTSVVKPKPAYGHSSPRALHSLLASPPTHSHQGFQHAVHFVAKRPKAKR